MEINDTGATISVIPPGFVPAYSACVSVPRPRRHSEPRAGPGEEGPETGVGAGSCPDALPGHTARNAGRKAAIKTEKPRAWRSPRPPARHGQSAGKAAGPAPRPALTCSSAADSAPSTVPLSSWVSLPESIAAARATAVPGGAGGEGSPGAALLGAGPASRHGARPLPPPGLLSSALPPLLPASLSVCPRLPAGGGFSAGLGPAERGSAGGSSPARDRGQAPPARAGLRFSVLAGNHTAGGSVCKGVVLDANGSFQKSVLTKWKDRI